VILNLAGRPDGVETEMVVVRSWLNIVLDPSDDTIIKAAGISVEQYKEMVRAL